MVATQERAADYDFDRRLTKRVPDEAGAGVRAPLAIVPPRAGDWAAVDEFLQRLARAVQQFRTYPPTSPLCEGAVDTARHALAAIEHREHIAFRVTPHDLIVDEAACGRGSLIEHELARRLHGASIAEVTIDRAASARELTHFCLDLVHCGDKTGSATSLIERLAEHGVDRIALRAAYRPEILDVGHRATAVAGLIELQHRRQEDAFVVAGAVNHLYPPDKGWVRLDPWSPLPSISLLDLALLADDPGGLATMLLRLTDGEPTGGGTRDEALAQKFGDVAMLFNALEPRVARVMFGRLAQAVLALEPVRRQELLRRTILPGLLDGKLEGGILKDFPDLDLADSLCLLLDLETAVPEVVTAALARLDLPVERQAAIVPLLERRLQDREAVAARDSSVVAHARKLVRVDNSRPRSYAEFAAFDLAIDRQTSEALDRIRHDIAATDIVAEQLDCLWKLIRIEPNPDVVQRFVAGSTRLFVQLEQAGCVGLLAAWLGRFRELASSLSEVRQDVAAVINAGLAALGTPERAARVLELAERDDDGRAAADAMIRALGGALAAPLLAAVQNRTRTSEATAKTAVRLLCAHATLMAPVLADLFGGADAELNRVMARVLGLAGSGFESTLATGLGCPDEQTVRESLRSLARIGTPQAAAIVGAEIERDHGWIGAAAEETLWRFPATHAERQTKDLLERRAFVVKHPALAVRLLDRAAHAGTTGLEPILASLIPLRYRIWNPALVRLARKAQVMEKR